MTTSDKSTLGVLDWKVCKLGYNRVNDAYDSKEEDN